MEQHAEKNRQLDWIAVIVGCAALAVSLALAAAIQV